MCCTQLSPLDATARLPSHYVHPPSPFQLLNPSTCLCALLSYCPEFLLDSFLDAHSGSGSHLAQFFSNSAPLNPLQNENTFTCKTSTKRKRINLVIWAKLLRMKIRVSASKTKVALTCLQHFCHPPALQPQAIALHWRSHKRCAQSKIPKAKRQVLTGKSW